MDVADSVVAGAPGPTQCDNHPGDRGYSQESHWPGGGLAAALGDVQTFSTNHQRRGSALERRGTFVRT